MNMENSLELLRQTKIKHIMNQHATTVNINDELSAAQMKFTSEHLTHLVVVDNENKVVGLLSQKYLYKTRSPRKVVSEVMEYRPDLLRDGADTFYTKDMLDSYILERIMQARPLTLGLEDTLAEAILHMANKKLGCIPVVDNENRIQGVLTHFEIIGFLSRFC
jgi:CBS-domain-containing membrane protein